LKNHHRIANILYLWILSILGFIAILPSVNKLFLGNIDSMPSTSLIMAQAIITTGIYATIGSLLAPKVGFNPPIISYILNKQKINPPIKKQIYHSTIIGGIGSVLMFFGSAEFATYINQFSITSRIIGAGLYEELMARWFLMTFLIWLFWFIFNRKSPYPNNIIIWLGLIISNLFFIVGHYPGVSMSISDNISILNMFFWMFIITLPWGWLFWKYGIESAIIAHSAFHVFFILLQL
jgi:membrane protease YdiL (CAAX protease family)|tara:strand:+ start:50 stop:757 length:708 start_codon:yes stop_codon:yes gene_type:complete